MLINDKGIPYAEKGIYIRCMYGALSREIPYIRYNTVCIYTVMTNPNAYPPLVLLLNSSLISS